jgi:hypothetical protein
MAATRVSERDREHFRKLGRWKYESHREAFLRHMELPIAERLVRSIAWTLDELPAWKWPRNGDGPGALHKRARELGLAR